MLGSLTSKLIAALVALAVLAGAAWWISHLYDSRAEARAALATAVAANATNQATIDRLEADQITAQAVAISDARERAKLEDESRELEDAANAVKSTGDCGSLDAILERRRLQRQAPGGGANPGR
jgi:hypothetical protein